MAKTDIGPKIGIEGEAQFRRELNQINQGMKTLDAEARAVAASMQDETDAEKKAAAQKDIMNRQILSQKEKLEKLKDGLEASARKYGEADTRTQKWQKSVYDATADLADMEHKLKGLDGAVDDAADSMEDAESAATGWADVMKGQLLADTVKVGVKALAGFIRDTASAMWEASKAGAAYADTYNTMAATTGLSTETLQEYAYMADLIDVSLDTLTGAQTKLLQSMRKARDGTGEAAETWKTLGVNIKNADGSLRSTEEVLNETLTALGKIENETERDAAAMTVFGRSAQELNPLIETGAEKLDELRKEAHDAGYVLSGSALTALDKQQDAMDRLQKKSEAVSNAFAVKMAPGIESAYNTLGDALENPRVKRGLNIVSTGIGDIISGAAELAGKILPGLFSVFSLGDARLRLYSDAELELVNKAEELAESHQTLMSEFRDNAGAIVGETERIQGLWGELQTLTDENGNVTDANKERVDFILSELNSALGTEYERNGELINQYQDMQKEIGGLIKQREAEALLEAGKTAYTEAMSKRAEALQAAADLYPQVTKAQEEYNAALDYAKEHKGEIALPWEKNPELELAKAAKKLETITKDYEDAQQSAAEYYEAVDRYQRAQSAALQGNYNDVVRILADELGVTMEYYRQKKELNEQDKKDLEDKIESAERSIEEYKRNLENGLTGFSKEGLNELQGYVDEAKKILNGEDVAKAYTDGLAKGLRENKKNVKTAAEEVAKSVATATKSVLKIASPSKVGVWVGQMWDEGLIKGMEDRENELRMTARSLADTMTGGTWGSAAAINDAGYSAAYARPIGGWDAGGGTSSHTINLGGINITIPGAEGLNEQALAERVAVRLTDELMRASRGGRL
jgi:hypothetical protein